MAVRVRLTRVGSRKNPVWRVVVADQRSPRDGRVIETVGRYNPQRQPSEIVLDHDRLEHWISRGAQPSDTVQRLMQASIRERPPAAAAPRQSAPTPRPSGSDGASSSDGASEPDAGGTGERAEPDASAAPQAGSEPPDASERGADADQESSSSGAAEEGTPVPTTEPPQEEGPAAEPADEAPSGAAPAGPAPQAEDNA